ncbi:hypothetical protein LWI28_021586 [Acer negundo]|uniref:Uncharacterized protein n=1 Tax=Acer negundo TaxID=4023 RepID=A0AAD5P2Q9_ACENE|nr:hypothetical protein LWI28_021586 [Acer negundo]
MAMVIGGGGGGDGLEDLGCLLNDDEKPAPLFKSKPALTGQPWPHSHYIYRFFHFSTLMVVPHLLLLHHLLFKSPKPHLHFHYSCLITHTQIYIYSFSPIKV